MTVEFQDHRCDSDSMLFGDLEIGQSFQCIYRHGDIYIKTKGASNKEYGVNLNCVSLGHSFRMDFAAETAVYPICILISIQDA